LVFFLTGCESIFHSEEISIGEIKNYGQLAQAANGVYGKLAQALNDNNFYSPNIKGDDINCIGLHYGYSEYYSNLCYSPEGTLNTGYLWSSLYQTIASSNSIISQYEDFLFCDKPTLKILGEILFIRAYCYFRLTRTYGEIPLIDNTDVSYTLSGASFHEIYDFIESDLKTAMALLPENNTTARVPYETPHRGTAKALLSEVYLSRAGYPLKNITDYELAAREAGEVIDSADYFGFGLVDDFARLWDNVHYHNSETILTLYFSNPLQTHVFDEVNLIYVIPYSGNSSMGDYFLNREFPCMFGFFPVELNFFNNYPRGYRKDITFYTTIYVPNIYPFYPEIDTGFIQVDVLGPCSRASCRKFFYEPFYVPFNAYFDYVQLDDFYYILGSPKIYLFRYAHTLLTYAEAAARSGQLDEKAYECINRIRRRAHNVDIYSSSDFDLQPGLSPEVFADSVVWERAWELAGEPEGRWFDLVRLEMVEDLPALRHPAEGGPPEAFDKSVYFFPVPEGDIRLNPNLDIE
jgi:hypothetical protein